MNASRTCLRLSGLLTTLALVAGHSSALAASTYAYDGSTPYCTQASNANANNYGNSYNCTPTLSGSSSNYTSATSTMTGYSTTATSASGGKPSGVSSSGTVFDVANVADWGSSNGYGVQNKVEGLSASTGDHAIDNYNGTDVMLLSFSSSVILQSFQIGWSGTSSCGGNACANGAINDSDASLLRYTGTSAPVVTGKTISGLLSDGWTLVGNWADLATNATATVSGGAASSWWLVSAYNSLYTTANCSTCTPTSQNGGALGNSNDAFKLLSYAAASPSTSKTPEPGSLALAGLGLLGLLGVRRRLGAAADASPRTPIAD